MKNNTNIKKISLAALFAALSFVATLISFPLPTGYANLGDCIVFMTGFMLGMPWGIAGAAIGSLFADLILGYAVYIPATVVLKSLIALAGVICAKQLLRRKRKTLWSRIMIPVFSFAGEILMVFGYFTYEYFVLGVGEAAIVSIPVNLAQGAVGIISSVAIATVFLKVPLLARLMNTMSDSKKEKNDNV